MDQKGVVLFEVSRNDRNYVLSVPMNAQYSEIYDVALEYAGMALEKINQAAAEIEKQRKELAEKAKNTSENPEIKAAKEDNNE